MALIESQAALRSLEPLSKPSKTLFPGGITAPGKLQEKEYVAHGRLTWPHAPCGRGWSERDLLREICSGEEIKFERGQ